MKYKPYIWLAVVCTTALGVVIPGRTQQNKSSNILFQTSTINALMAGVYDGDTNFKQLKAHGNFGLGTLNNLDGEMIGLDGKFYQIKSDGVAYPIPDAMKTPFAAVTFFKSDRLINLAGKLNYQQMQQTLDRKLPSRNYPYAIRIQGTFPYLKVRSVSKQTPPYRPLVEVVKNQSIFELKNVKGTLVGFRTPTYMQGVNVSGYHLHFITENRKTGGHLLDGQFQNLQVEIDQMSDVRVDLPKNSQFNQANLEGDKAGEVNKVER
ncbi:MULTISPECIES: acetolactate decarboxylase [Fischerella]|uniref:acetolactate decarboxylase n=1 Tax=Fischerella TaxID=1190 RepID=UPI0002F85F92|nr:MULTISPECIES: acetolactate decarboxylase [Fischerella]MBD2434758.1 acetolactate decarboxylase [Fischerella sp. FACHB-380]